MSKHLRWESHKGHWELLKEFYALNKYLITEQLKDTLLDAIECMEYTMTEEGENMKQYVEINVIREQIGERFGFPIEDVIEDLPIANDVQEKKYCKMIPLEPDLRNCTNVFICTNCHQHIHLGFIRKEYSGRYCLECGAEVKDGEEND